MSEPKESYGRCLVRGSLGLASRHYDLFVASHPDIQALFNASDPEEHKKTLRHMHTVLLMFGSGDRYAETALVRTARKHGPTGMDVHRDLYEMWAASLIEAVRECDPEFDPEVEEAWQDVVQNGVQFFIVATQMKDAI